MDGKTRRFLGWIIVALAILLPASASGQARDGSGGIRPASPTHYFYTPTPYGNPPHALIVGLHELSYALPYRLQLQASIFDNIGRLNVAARYSITDRLAIAAGLAHSLIHVGRGAHGIPHWASPRFGMFLCFGPLVSRSLEIGITPHTQLGDHVSVGGDIGFRIIPHDFWSIILEFGTSLDATDTIFYMNIDGGVRIHPPSIPFMHFDLGVDIEEFAVSEGASPTVTVFFDVIFGMMTS